MGISNWKAGCVLTAVFVQAAFSLVTVSPASALIVKPGHPRIFFHADSMAAIRARCAGANSPVFSRYKQIFDGVVADPANHNQYYVAHFACLYLLTGETTYRDAAVGTAMFMARHDQQTTGQTMGPASISNLILTYDWAYDAFTQAQRDSIVQKIVSGLHNDPNRSGYKWLWWDVVWGYAYGIANDAGADNPFILSILQDTIDYTNTATACLDVLSPNGAIDGYAGTRIWKMFALADCLRLGADYDLYGTSQYIRNSDKYWLARFRSDFQWTRTPGKYNTTESAPVRLFSFMASRLGNPYCQTVAKTIIDTNHWRDNDGILEGPLILAYYIPSHASSPLSQAPRVYYDSGMGFFLSHSEWDLSSSSTDVTVGFFNGPDAVEHRTQNHFFIARGMDNLIIDSGCYKHDLDDHYSNYYKRAIAHNVVTIYDQSEGFGEYTNVWGTRRNIANDGGQWHSDLARGRARWPTCDGCYGYRGEITVYEETPDYVQLIGNASPAYDSTKVRRVLRRFVYLRPNWVIVQDRILLSKPNLPVRSIFHSIERPTVDGPVSVIEGDLVHGGVYRAPDARVITIDRGGSSARVFVVQAEGGSSEVRIVGGHAATGNPWRQWLEPHDLLTYDPALQGYDSYVDGTNYPAGGPLLTQSDIDNRNASGANPAGDWRTEVLVQNTTNEVRITFLVQVVAQGAPLAQVTSRVEGDVLSIEVQDEIKSFHLALCPPGDPCADVIYQH